MAFIYAIDPTTPSGSEAASLGDDRIREFKNAVVERLQQLVTDYTTDPYRLQITSTVTPQAQVRYDASNRLSISISSAGAVTYDAVGASASHTFADGVSVSAGTTAVQAFTATTGAFTGDVAIGSNAGSDRVLRLNAAAGSLRDFRFQTAGVDRWIVRTNNQAEAGADAGSAFEILARTDAGVLIDSVLSIVRAAGGVMTIVRPLTVSNALTVTTTSSFGDNATASNIILSLNRPAGQNRFLRFQTAGVSRWDFGANNAAEGGADAGSNIQLAAYTDAAVLIDVPWTIVRAAGGAMTIARPIQATAGGATVSTTGSIRLNNTGVIGWRNAANGANITLQVNGSDVFAFTAGISVSAGTTAVQALTATTGVFSSTLSATQLTLTTAVSKIIPGATSLSLRNNADSADNILVTDAGVVTIRSTLTATQLTLTTAVSKIIPGATSLSLRNNADSADNLILTDAGVATIRAGLTVTAGTTALQATTVTTVTASTALVGPGTTAAAGAVRLANAASINWRNFAGSGDLGMTLTNADLLVTGMSVSVTGSVAATSSILSSSASGGIGYSTGAGSTVTQLTSKSTAVTLDFVCGQITMNNAALAAGAKVVFTVNDSRVATTDGVNVWIDSGGTANAYRADVVAVGAGSFAVCVENITAGSLSEAPVVGFQVIKAVTS